MSMLLVDFFVNWCIVLTFLLRVTIVFRRSRTTCCFCFLLVTAHFFDIVIHYDSLCSFSVDTLAEADETACPCCVIPS